MKDFPPAARNMETPGTIPERQEYHGLCSSCCNALACTYPRDPKKPVMQCDEFDGSLISPFKSSGIPFSIADLPAPSPRISNFRGKPLNEHKGLCGICEARTVCAYPKPEGGVWHCEEYR